MSDQRFDGIEVQKFGGRFAGTFDLSESFPVDTEVAFIVVARVTGADMSVTKGGDLKRTNKLTVLEVAVTGSNDGSKRIKAVQADVNDQLDLDDDDLGDEFDELLEEQSRVVIGGTRNVGETPAEARSTTVPVGHTPQRPELYSDGGWA